MARYIPVNGSTHLIPAYYSFYRPRKDERLSWPSWLTYSGWLTHISGHLSAAGRAQDRESSPARDRRSTTVPRHQRHVYCTVLEIALLTDMVKRTVIYFKCCANSFRLFHLYFLLHLFNFSLLYLFSATMNDGEIKLYIKLDGTQ